MRSFPPGERVLVPRAFLQRSLHACIEHAGNHVRFRDRSAEPERFAPTVSLIAAESSAASTTS